VTHVRGSLLEESHYYPFGLTMAGISSKALSFGNPENKIKFVSQELDSDLELNWYQFRYRNHDPQIGRFVQIDPLADDYVHNSPYAYAENRVINGIDLEGLEWVPASVLQNPNFNYNSYQNSFRSESTNQSYQRKSGELAPMPAAERAALKGTPASSAFELKISVGKQLGVGVGDFALEVNGGSQPVLKVGSNGTVEVGNPKNEYTEGVTIQAGAVGYSGETVTSTEQVNYNIPGTNLSTVLDKTTETTSNNLSIGIKKTPLSVGVQNTQQTTSFTQFGHTVLPTTTTSTGLQPYVGAPSASPKTSVPVDNKTKISISAGVKVEIGIDIGRILSSIKN
jgi:RHS repeat-associated protein